MKNKISHRFLIVILLTALLSACATGPTSEAEEYIKLDVAERSKGYLELTSFKKVDGVEEDNRGQKSYKILYEMEVTAVKSGGWIQLENGKLVSGPNMHYPSYPYSVYDVQCEVEGLEHQCKNTQIQEGQKFSGRNIVKLVKTDNGWHGVRTRY